MNKLATVTIKSTGLAYDVYSVPGSQGDYPVWARLGYACHCPCKSRTFNPQRRCKHMLDLQRELDTQRRSAPLARKEFAVLKTGRNSA